MPIAKTKHWTIIGGALLGVVIGDALKRAVVDPRHPPGHERLSVGSERDPSAPQSIAATLSRKGDQDPYQEALRRTSHTQRWLWLATQAESASPADMPRLIQFHVMQVLAVFKHTSQLVARFFGQAIVLREHAGKLMQGRGIDFQPFPDKLDQLALNTKYRLR